MADEDWLTVGSSFAAAAAAAAVDFNPFADGRRPVASAARATDAAGGAAGRSSHDSRKRSRRRSRSRGSSATESTSSDGASPSHRHRRADRRAHKKHKKHKRRRSEERRARRAHDLAAILRELSALEDRSGDRNNAQFEESFSGDRPRYRALRGLPRVLPDDPARRGAAAPRFFEGALASELGDRSTRFAPALAARAAPCRAFADPRAAAAAACAWHCRSAACVAPRSPSRRTPPPSSSPCRRPSSAWTPAAERPPRSPRCPR